MQAKTTYFVGDCDALSLEGKVIHIQQNNTRFGNVATERLCARWGEEWIVHSPNGQQPRLSLAKEILIERISFDVVVGRSNSCTLPTRPRFRRLGASYWRLRGAWCSQSPICRNVKFGYPAHQRSRRVRRPAEICSRSHNLSPKRR
jgi:hypothetical protein